MDTLPRKIPQARSLYRLRSCRLRGHAPRTPRRSRSRPKQFFAPRPHRDHCLHRRRLRPRTPAALRSFTFRQRLAARPCTPWQPSSTALSANTAVARPSASKSQLPIPATTKYTAGYRLQPHADRVDLFCGSEGTLGVTLAGRGRASCPSPPKLFASVIFFAADEDASAAVSAWRSVPALNMMEYADRNALEMIRVRYPEIPRNAAAALLIEADGDDVEAWETRLEQAHALIEASWFAVSPQRPRALPPTRLPPHSSRTRHRNHAPPRLPPTWAPTTPSPSTKTKPYSTTASA